jgi:hypothetical protein
MYSCGHWDKLLGNRKGKAYALHPAEGIRPSSGGRHQFCMWYGECAGHHRGLRAEHVFKGVARKLERANCLLVQFECIRYLGRIAKSEQT